MTVELSGERIDVFFHRPRHCKPLGALIVLPGYRRNARAYRRYARRLSRMSCHAVYVPKFSRKAFPRWRYQWAGVIHRDVVQPPERCTGHLLNQLIESVRAIEGRSELPVVLFGHSAGAQLLSRALAYCPPKNVQRVIIANPSAYVGASLSELPPYGFDGLSEWPDDPSRMLQAYLAQPITIVLGAKDTGKRLLSDHEGATRQGRNRKTRGLYVFRSARSIAEVNGWPFGWRLSVLPGVGHSGNRVLRELTPDDLE